MTSDAPPRLFSPPAEIPAVGAVRTSHFPRPHLLTDIRAEFPAWATDFAARLLPGLSLPVADTELHGRAWGLMSRSAGIRLDLAAMAAATGAGALRGFHLATEALGILIHEIAHAACWKRPEERPALSPPEAAAVVERWARQDAVAPPDPARGSMTTERSSSE